jgi:hypothetical protein
MRTTLRIVPDNTSKQLSPGLQAQLSGLLRHLLLAAWPRQSYAQA